MVIVIDRGGGVFQVTFGEGEMEKIRLEAAQKEVLCRDVVDDIVMVGLDEKFQ